MLRIIKDLLKKNRHFAKKYDGRYLDMMSKVLNYDSKVRVFTPDNHFISPDCAHLSQSGARYFATLIDLQDYLDN